MKRALEIVSQLAVIGLCFVGVLMYIQGPTQARPGGPKTIEPPKELVTLEGAETQGSATAPVVLLVFSDFECPYCSKFAKDVLPALQDKYVKPGKLQIAFRNFPLAMHQQAVPAAVAAVCAGQQGKFWAAHDGFFADQAVLKTEWAPVFVKKHGLDRAAFEACVLDTKTDARVKADAAIAKRYGLTGTPSILIGTRQAGGVKVTRVIPGVDTVDNFAKVIDPLLK